MLGTRRVRRRTMASSVCPFRRVSTTFKSFPTRVWVMPRPGTRSRSPARETSALPEGGKVRGPNGDPVSRANVRMLAKVGADGTVVVGETKAEEDGSYMLAVPADLGTPATAK